MSTYIENITRRTFCPSCCHWVIGDVCVFYMLDEEMCKRDRYVDKKTGESVKFTLTMKVIYTYLLRRYKYFVEEKGGVLYDTHSMIAQAFSIDEKTVSRTLSDFRKHGILEGKMVKPNNCNHRRMVYTWMETDIQYEKGVDIQPEPSMIADIEYTDAYLGSIKWE
ncbi:hypothetical protein D3C75_469760 [compost metagenome]